MKKFLKKLKKIKLRSLISLVLILMLNTYAWFVYVTKVNTEISAHVKSWKINFVNSSNQSFTNITINIDDIYPGMEEYEERIKIYNTGEMIANLVYELQSARILSTTYTNSDSNSSSELEQTIAENYPFTIYLGYEDPEVEEEGLEKEFVIRITWNYDSGTDDEDTLVGTAAHQFNEENPDVSSISLEIQLRARQYEESTNSTT